MLSLGMLQGERIDSSGTPGADQTCTACVDGSVYFLLQHSVVNCAASPVLDTEAFMRSVFWTILRW